MDGLRAQMESAHAFPPSTAREHAWFRAVAVTAGICEELVYRGYLIWYGSTFVSPWLALLGATVLFGLGHSYQGPAGVLKTAVLGAVVGALYLLTGSLLWPMVLHAAVDLQGGALGRRVLGTPVPPAGSGAPA